MWEHEMRKINNPNPTVDDLPLWIHRYLVHRFHVLDRTGTAWASSGFGRVSRFMIGFFLLPALPVSAYPPSNPLAQTLHSRRWYNR